MSGLLKEFWAFREELAARFFEFRVGEAAGVALEEPAESRTDERLAQCIWFDSSFVGTDMKTESGKRFEIVQTGRWNQEEGPDFLDAKVRINGKILRGDVEIHLYREGWRQHRHHLNRVYDSVVLHAYLWPSGGAEPAPVRTSRGDAIEGFLMEPALFPDLETIRQTVRVEEYPYQTLSAEGRCQPLMCSLEAGYVSDLLDAAGRERLEAKMQRFSDQARGEAIDQVFYQAILSSMGLKAGKGLFFLLSKRAPLGEMLDYLRGQAPEAFGDEENERHGEAVERANLFIQSVLLHVSRLAPEAGFKPEADDVEMGVYLETIRRLWSGYANFYADRLIPPTRQWTSGVRPVNFAHRRVAGVSRLAARWFLRGSVADVFAEKIMGFDPEGSERERLRWIRRELIGAFVVEDKESFWAWRFNFNAKRSSRGMKLIGESRASSIVFNALLPLLLLHARRRRDRALEKRVWEVFAVYPALDSNSMVRHMRARLFGPHLRGKTLLALEARQQGLFQIFASCCNHNESGCEDCYYVKAHG